MEPLYLNLFDSKEDVMREFSNYGWDYETAARREGDVYLGDNVEIIIATYTYEDYSGSAYVLYHDTNDGKLYEVFGSHCSCYGLEGQWAPEEANIDALLMRKNWDYYGEDYSWTYVAEPQSEIGKQIVAKLQEIKACEEK
jgi:hypothetical protein